MKSLVLFAVCAISATAAAAEWHYLSGGKLSGISSVGSFVWAVGQDGLMFYSEDNGQYWRRVPRFTARNLVDVEFWNQSLGLVTTEGGIVFRTTNDGVSWDSMTVPHGGNRIHWLSVSRVDISASESSFVVRSSDAGQTWLVRGTSAFAPWFLDSIQGWGGQSPGVMRTRDGGGTWTKIGDLPSNPAYARAFGFVDTSSGICGWYEYFSSPHGSYQAYLWAATNDGGLTWTQIPGGGSTTPIRCCDVDAAGDIYGLDADHFVRYHCPVPGSVYLGKWQWFYDMSAARGDYPWICGLGSATQLSTDGGQSWQSARPPSVGSALTNVEFTDSTHGWGTGYGGMVIKSTDAGRSWTDVSVPVSGGNPYTNITVMNETTVVCCLGYSEYTEMGYYWYGYFAALRTSNSGASWDTTRFVNVQSDRNGPIGSSRIARSDQCLWHAGLRMPNGNSIRSTDGGMTWLDMDTLGVVSDRQEPYDISFVDALHGWAIDSRKNIRVTNNSGDSWTITATDLGVKRLKMTSLTTGWAISDSELFETTDGGMNWQSVKDQPGLQAIAFCDSCHGAIVGLNGLLLRTSDAGQTWARDSSEFTSDLYHVCMLGSTHAWAVGENGLVLGFGDWAIGVDEARGNEGPYTRTAAVAVRPNPCRGRATVEFSRPLMRPMRVTLVDAAGRMMQSVSARVGARSLDLDVRGMPSGIYFLRAGSGSAARLVVQH
jgi:photosystem II stability/assembly factor-like uncharacterized protein